MDIKKETLNIIECKDFEKFINDYYNILFFYNLLLEKDRKLKNNTNIINLDGIDILIKIDVSLKEDNEKIIKYDNHLIELCKNEGKSDTIGLDIAFMRDLARKKIIKEQTYYIRL